MAKTKDKTKKIAEKEVKGTALVPKSTYNFDDELDKIEKKIGISNGAIAKNEARMSTGLLAQDLTLGGGITAGWYSTSGKEQSCKTTGSITSLASAVKREVPIIGLIDAEGSTGGDTTYVETIFNSIGLKIPAKDLFDEYNSDGKLVKRGIIRYRDESIGEKVFDWIAAICKILPDKLYLGDKWYFVYEDTPENKKRHGDKVDAKITKNYGNGLCVPAPDGSLQAVILLDSFPALLPSKLDEWDRPGAGIASQARMFSDNIKRVKGHFKSKRVALLGINQLRSIPMAMYGPTEDEPGGQALKYFSDVRLRYTPRVSGIPYNPKFDKGIEYDLGGKYRYIHVKQIKNKLSVPGKETWIRLWIEDKKGRARGFDPVFDTLYYLNQTGQCSGKKHQLTLKFAGNEAKKTVTWKEFYALHFAPKADKIAIYKKIGMKPINLRQACANQLKSEKALDLYRAQQNKEKDDDDEDDPEGE